MATIATVNTSDKVLILGNREAYKRDMNFGSSWTEIRIGMFWTLVGNAGDDAAATAESITVANYKDIGAFGIKDSSDNPPQASGSQFVGFTFGLHGTANYSNGANNVGGTTLGAPYRVGLNGTTQLTAAASGDVAWNQQGGGRNSSLLLKFTVVNAGASNQTISMDTAGTHAYTDVTLAALRYQMFNPVSIGSSSITWNSGGVALPLPTHFYVRMPTLNNKMRITTYQAVKVS